MSQHARPRIERASGWLKTIAGLRKVKLRGLPNVDALFVFAIAAFNIRRIVTLRATAADGSSSPGFPGGAAETDRIITRFSATPPNC